MSLRFAHALLMSALLPVCFGTLVDQASAQSVRYRDPVFAQAQVQSDVPYGRAFNRWTRQAETLLLDIHAPEGDAAPARPAMVVVHGGGFVGGDKAAGSIARLAEEYARRGYVAVSINYRLVPNSMLVQSNPQQVAEDVKSDFKAAVRWLRSRAAQLRIDPDRIGGIGSSAGGITVQAGAYLEGEGTSGNPGFSSEVGCIVSLWGSSPAVNEMEAGEAPVCMIHGTQDPTVPYLASVLVDQQAQLVGIHSELIPIPGAGHGPWGTFFTSYLDDAVAFTWEHLRLAQLSGLAARPGAAAPGTLTLRGTGSAGFLRYGGVALDSGFLALGTEGDLCLDLTTLTIIELPPFPTGTRLPSVVDSYTLDASLAGLTLHLQDLHCDPVTGDCTLTNCVVVPL